VAAKGKQDLRCRSRDCCPRGCGTPARFPERLGEPRMPTTPGVSPRAQARACPRCSGAGRYRAAGASPTATTALKASDPSFARLPWRNEYVAVPRGATPPRPALQCTTRTISSVQLPEGRNRGGNPKGHTAFLPESVTARRAQLAATFVGTTSGRRSRGGAGHGARAALHAGCAPPAPLQTLRGPTQWHTPPGE